MTANQQVNWQDVLAFLSPNGQQQIVDFVRKAKEERGAGWLEYIKAEYPMMCYLVDLVANHSAEEAFAILGEQYPGLPLWLVKSQVISLHGALRSEIERKR